MLDYLCGQIREIVTPVLSASGHHPSLSAGLENLLFLKDYWSSWHFPSNQVRRDSRKTVLRVSSVSPRV